MTFKDISAIENLINYNILEVLRELAIVQSLTCMKSYDAAIATAVCLSVCLSETLTCIDNVEKVQDTTRRFHRGVRYNSGFFNYDQNPWLWVQRTTPNEDAHISTNTQS